MTDPHDRFGTAMSFQDRRYTRVGAARIVDTDDIGSPSQGLPEHSGGEQTIVHPEHDEREFVSGIAMFGQIIGEAANPFSVDVIHGAVAKRDQTPRSWPQHAGHVIRCRPPGCVIVDTDERITLVADARYDMDDDGASGLRLAEADFHFRVVWRDNDQPRPAETRIGDVPSDRGRVKLIQECAVNKDARIERGGNMREGMVESRKERRIRTHHDDFDANNTAIARWQRTVIAELAGRHHNPFRDPRCDIAARVENPLNRGGSDPRLLCDIGQSHFLHRIQVAGLKPDQI